jgi:C-terminal processing protease CtpA/Prc
MKTLRQFIWIFVIVAFCNVACEPEPIIPHNVPVVSQFIYDGMSRDYLWNEQMQGKRPTAADTDAVRYFESLLYTPTDRWSWITDDIQGLLDSFAGEATDAFGFAPLALLVDEATGRVEGLVRYVYPDTPAEEAGIRRGDVIIGANGAALTTSNFGVLFGANRETTFTVLDQNLENQREVPITPRNFPTNPVLHSSIHEIGGRRIGYLFYTGFRSNFNEYLFETFRKFHQANITDLVLDLRYNPGGDISAATYLASLIAPRAAVENQSVFTTLSFNKFINELYDERGWARNRYLGRFDAGFPNPLNANLNLNRVFILATEFSASASELITFCLRPYMEVVHIGGETSGKYTASWTIHAFNNFAVNGQSRTQTVYNERRLSSAQRDALRNWGMQPIVGRYTDRDGRDFVSEGTLTPDVQMDTRRQERTTENWKPIGDERDYLFAKAISLITGQSHVETPTSTRSIPDGQILFSPTEKLLRRAVNLDNVEIIEPEVLWGVMGDLK